MKNDLIIIDTDPGIDDAIAIMFLSKIKNIKIKGITTVGGNVSLEDTTRNACFLRQLMGLEDVKIYRGEAHPIEQQSEDAGNVHGQDGLGGRGYTPKSIDIEPEHAVDFLVKSVRENPKQITILALGPLTNIAKAILKDKDFASNVKQLVVMGGAEAYGNVTPQAEFNFAHDSKAAKIVYSAGFAPIVTVGLDTTKKVVVSPNCRDLIRHIPTNEAKFVYDISESHMDFWFERERALGFELCDPTAALYLTNPGMFKLQKAFVDIETSGLCAGCSVVYRKYIYKDKKVNALVATDIKAGKALKKIMSTLFPEQRSDFKRLFDAEYGS